MKLTKSYIASLLLLSGAFVACDDDPELPPVYVPHATITANTSSCQYVAFKSAIDVLAVIVACGT